MKDKVGRYQILQQIGKGGMGVVYLAEDPVLSRRVAIKTVELTIDDPQKRAFLLDRLIRDGRAAAGLSHPNIVSVYDVLEEGECGYLVMEYIAGETLSAYLRRVPRPDLPFTTRVLREMASALDYTHTRGIVHRDIKPANVMLDSTGAAKIMDFGIARIASSTTKTATGTVMGTLEYMSPEQIMGQEVDGRADQFSMAAMAFEMLSGEPIFPLASFATLTYKIVHESPPLLRTRVPEAPVAVEEVVARALRKQPAERFPTCGGFVAALESAFGGEVPVSVTTAATPRSPADSTVTTAMPAPPAPASANRGLLVGIAGLLGAALLGAGLLYWKPWVTPVVPMAAPPAATTAAVVEPPKPEPPKTPLPKQKPAPEPETKPEPHSPATPTPAATDTDADPGEAGAQPAARSAFEKGEVEFKAGRFQSAIGYYTKAIDAHPNFLKPRFARALVYQRMSRFSEAIPDYDAILGFTPRNALALAERGLCEARLNQDTAAQADLDKSLKFRTDIAAAYLGRGLLQMHRKDFAKAIEEFGQAIRINPNYTVAYRSRANAYRAMGNGAAAQADNKKADELGGGRQD